MMKTAKKPSGGFTLLELMVVVVIVGIAAGVVSLHVAPSEQRLLSEEAERLAALFRLAQDEARVRGRPVAWEADARGYRFVARDLKSTRADDLLRPREWPFPVRRVDAPRFVFGAEPLLPPGEILIETYERRVVWALDPFGGLTIKP